MSVESYQSVLILDDDSLLREDVLVPGLRSFGFSAIGFDTARESYRALLSRRFDAAVIDLSLPDEPGSSVIEHLRTSGSVSAIVVLTGLQGGKHVSEALDRGASAYLQKPVTVDLLAAALRAAIRQHHESRRVLLEFGGGDNKDWYVVRCNGTLVPFTILEKALLDVLRSAHGRPVHQDTIIESIAKGKAEFDIHRLEVVIHRLRRKIGQAAEPPYNIITVRGSGYALATL